VDNQAPWRALESPARGSAAESAPDAPAAHATIANRTAILVALVGAVAITVAAGVLAISAPGGTIGVGGGASIEGASEDPSAGPEIVIEVSGAVRNPGVYRLPASARVADAIEAAGGYGPRVDAERATAALDLAAHLADGATVAVPSRDDPPAAAGSSPGSGGSTQGLVNLNTATASELEALPGIGPVTAQKIIDARTERPFSSVEELRARGLVGEKTFERLRDLVTIG
jgi:competence protein ComEA